MVYSRYFFAAYGPNTRDGTSANEPQRQARGFSLLEVGSQYTGNPTASMPDGLLEAPFTVVACSWPLPARYCDDQWVSEPEWKSSSGRSSFSLSGATPNTRHCRDKTIGRCPLPF